MALSTFTAKLMEYKQTLTFWQVFGLLTAVLLVGFALVILKLAIFRKIFSKRMPCKKVKFIDILGNLNDLQWNNIGKNGWSFNVFFNQILLGYGALFPQAPIFSFWASYTPFIVFKQAEAVEALISGSKNMEKNWSYSMLHPWLGTGLLTSHGSKWKSRRKLLTPSFHFEILKDFLPIFNEQAQVLVKNFKKEVSKDYTDIVMPITLCSLDIICETTLGVSISAQENSESQYVKSVTRAGEIIMERIVNSRYWIDFLFQFMDAGKELKQHLKTLHNFTRSVIQEKKRKLLSGAPKEEEGTKRKRKALMDLLMEHHIQFKDLTEEDIREEVDTFAFEGHDTTSMGMSWALYLIGLYKDVQEKIHEELDRIFGDDLERPAETNDIKDMSYLDRVLKESQRLYPSVPLIARTTSEDNVICGIPIPKGSSCMVMVVQLHRNPKVFPNPELFNPDRFLPENSIGRHPYAYIPFSAGPRNCIGQRFAIMEEKIVISTILRHYTVESLDPRDKVLPAAELILRPSGPIRIRIRRRQRHHS